VTDAASAVLPADHAADPAEGAEPTVFVIGLLKGGTGKTTSAMMIALHYALEGRRVIVLDGDQTSQSAYDWYKLANKRDEQLPFEVERFPFQDEIAEHIGELRDTHDVIIVDAGGGNSTYFEEAVSAADVLLMPLAPTEAEARRLPATLKSAAHAAERNTRGVLVLVTLVKARDNTNEPKEWREQLQADQFPVTDTYVPMRVLYSRAYGHLPAEVGPYADLVAEIEKERTA
jgi:chromosome partitioning protein